MRGSGISSSSGFTVTTSVNQNFLKGEITVKTDTERIVPERTSGLIKN
jgi:hypothetical protein